MLTPLTDTPLRLIDDDGRRLGEWSAPLGDVQLLRTVAADVP
ncbi:hypothetical protein [Deinococcus sp.]|nr:hypothetical protein [Deinococcus sp.]